MSEADLADPVERKLYGWRRRPSPRKVGDELRVSHDHVKRLCRALSLPMQNVGIVGRQPRWKIPLETFRALRVHLAADAGGRSETRSVR